PDGKLWVLGFIVILILIFVSKMSFLSLIEKAHTEINILLLSLNDQDMPEYGVLYRLRPSAHYSSSLSWLSRCIYRLNLGLPRWTVDLTTIDHIDEYSYQDHPASDPHATPEEVVARENELPTYRPKLEDDPQHQEVVLAEARPPKYRDVIVEMETCPQQQPHQEQQQHHQEQHHQEQHHQERRHQEQHHQEQQQQQQQQAPTP
ncbi:hypothetical protein BGZ65_000076, partial [Modicella reniformis]